MVPQNTKNAEFMHLVEEKGNYQVLVDERPGRKSS